MLSEHAGFRIVPNVKDTSFGKIAEDLGIYGLVPSGDITTVSMPQKIARVNVSSPGNECAARFNEFTLSALRRNCR